MASTALLEHGLTLAAAAQPPARTAAAVSGADPLRLDLPPLPGLKAAPELLRALSALYLAARVEETGLVQVSELLIRERATLRVPIATAARLEELARRAGQALTRDERLALYARLFGRGPGAHVDAVGAGARFEPLLGALCSAIVAHAARSVVARPGALEQAATDLAAAAGLSAGGNAVFAVARVNDQLRGAIDVLADPGVAALVGGRDMWDTLARLVAPAVPDVRRALDCGRGGQRVLLWVATVAPVLDGPRAPRIDTGRDVAKAAATWLFANGLALPKAGLV